MPRLPVAAKLPFWKTLNQAGVWRPGPAQQVEPPRRLIIGAVPLASPTESCSAPGTNLTKLASAYALLTASPALTGLPTSVMREPFVERPAEKRLGLAQTLEAFRRAMLAERRASEMVPAVPSALMALTICVPVIWPPAPLAV